MRRICTFLETGICIGLSMLPFLQCKSAKVPNIALWEIGGGGVFAIYLELCVPNVVTLSPWRVCWAVIR